jgi:hypothetical protein
MYVHDERKREGKKPIDKSRISRKKIPTNNKMKGDMFWPNHQHI